MNHALRTPRLWTTLLALAATFGSVAFAADDDRPVVSDKNFGKDAAAPTTLPTLFLVGDSTMNSGAPLRGWASEVGAYFDRAKITVVNRAIGGRSSRTFINEGKWDRVLGELKPGDFVVVQFGHNDVGRYDDPAAKGRPSLHGEGDDTAEVTKPDGSKETVHTFGWYLRKYGADAKARGATAIFCSMVPHKDWSSDGKHIVRKERDAWVKWTQDAAQATGAYYVDLNEISAEGMEKLGRDKVEALFGDKRTHSTPEGAKFNARCFVAGLKALPNDPLAPYLGKESEAVEPAEVEDAPATQPAGR